MSAVLEAAGTLSYLLAALLAAVPFGPAEATALAGGLLTTGAALQFWVMVPVLGLGMLLGDLTVFLTVRRAAPRLLGHWMPKAAEAGTSDRRRTLRSSERSNRLWLSPDRRPVGWMHLLVLGARFVPGARTPATALAAASSLGLGRYSGLSAVGAGLWALTWVTAGRLSGEAGVPLGCLLLGGVLTSAVIAAALNAGIRGRRAHAGRRRTHTAATPATGAVAAGARSDSPRKDTPWTPS